MPDKPAKVASAKRSADASHGNEESAAPSRTRRKDAKGKPVAAGGGKKRRAGSLEPTTEPAPGAVAPASKPRSEPSRTAKRKPPRQTFLVAASLVAVDGLSRLRVYAAVVRSAAEALAAVRAEVGPEVPVELTGKLSNRMAKALGLKPDEVRPI